MKASNWGFLTGITLVVLMFIGWIMNIVKVFDADVYISTGEMVVRVIGIIVPFIGAVIGWF